MLTPDVDLPGALVSVDARLRLAKRLTAEFKSGNPIIVRGHGEELLASLDMMSRSTMEGFLEWTTGPLLILLTAGRASTLVSCASIMPPEQAVALRVCRTFSCLQYFSDFTRRLLPNELEGDARIVELPSSAASAIKLARNGHLIPTFALASVTNARMLSARERLLTIDISEMLAACIDFEQTVTLCGAAHVPIDGCKDARMFAFRSDFDGTEYLAVQIGDIDAATAPLVRLHSSCLTGDLLSSLRCDCGEQLRSSVSRIIDEGCGILLYLPQEGRGIGLTNKIRAYHLQDEGADTVDANHLLGWEDDPRSYGAAASMLKTLGANRIRLLSNNPAKCQNLQSLAITVVEMVPHAVTPTSFNAHYLATKRERCGHILPT
ncbi:MAG: GTP cyclohydrolase II [Beijerinckiaceae bacterium]|nr:MAG: GTP cyclohydrolase II [Beijerinckiaceae bacterium]